MRTVVLGAGVAGEAFVAALRRLDADVRDHARRARAHRRRVLLLGLHPLEDAAPPARARLPDARSRPGSATASPRSTRPPSSPGGTRSPEQDDTSQADWVEGLGVEVVRGEAEVVEPGLVRVDGRELPYDELMIATGSVPAAPPIDGLSDVGALDEPRRDDARARFRPSSWSSAAARSAASSRSSTRGSAPR